MSDNLKKLARKVRAKGLTQIAARRCGVPFAKVQDWADGVPYRNSPLHSFYAAALNAVLKEKKTNRE